MVTNWGCETALCIVLGVLSQLKRSIPDLRLHKATHQPLIGKLGVRSSTIKTPSTITQLFTLQSKSLVILEGVSYGITRRLRKCMYLCPQSFILFLSFCKLTLTKLYGMFMTNSRLIFGMEFSSRQFQFPTLLHTFQYESPAHLILTCISNDSCQKPLRRPQPAITSELFSAQSTPPSNHRIRTIRRQSSIGMYQEQHQQAAPAHGGSAGPLSSSTSYYTNSPSPPHGPEIGTQEETLVALDGVTTSLSVSALSSPSNEANQIVVVGSSANQPPVASLPTFRTTAGLGGDVQDAAGRHQHEARAADAAHRFVGVQSGVGGEDDPEHTADATGAATDVVIGGVHP